MERRTFMGMGAGALVAAPHQTSAQEQLVLTISSDLPDRAEALSSRIEAVSDGAITIAVQPIEKSAAPGVLAEVSSGDTDCFLVSADAFISQNPAFGLFASTPGGMSSSELESWIIMSDGRFMWDLVSGEFGIKSFMIGDKGPTPLWSRTRLEGAAGLSTSNVGATGLAIAAWQDLGAANVVDLHADGVNLDDLMIIDGMSVEDMSQAGLFEQFPHMTAANGMRPTNMLSLGMNMDRWSALTEQQQMLLERCIMAEHASNRSLYADNNMRALTSAGDAIVRDEMPDDIWEAQVVSSSTVLLSLIEHSDISADAADAYIYFLRDVAGWSAIGEAAYFQGRNKALLL